MKGKQAPLRTEYLGSLDVKPGVLSVNDLVMMRQRQRPTFTASAPHMKMTEGYGDEVGDHICESRKKSGG